MATFSLLALLGRGFLCSEGAAPNWGHRISKKPKVALSDWQGEVGSGVRVTPQTCRLQTLLVLPSPAW